VCPYLRQIWHGMLANWPPWPQPPRPRKPWLEKRWVTEISTWITAMILKSEDLHMIESSLPKEGKFSSETCWIHGQEEELQLLLLEVFQTYFQLHKQLEHILAEDLQKNSINIFIIFDVTSNSNKFTRNGLDLSQ